MHEEMLATLMTQERERESFQTIHRREYDRQARLMKQDHRDQERQARERALGATPPPASRLAPRTPPVE